MAQRLANALGTIILIRQPLNERVAFLDLDLTSFDQTIFESVLSSMEQAVYVRDAARRLLYINPAAERMTGWSLPEALERPCFEVFGDEGGRCNQNCPIDRAIKAGEAIVHTEGTVLNRAGEPVEVRVSISPMRKDGDVIGSVVLLDDLKLLKDAERTRVKALMQLEEAEIELRNRLDEVERLRAQATENHQHLIDAIETLQEGFAFFDVDDQLIAWNGRYSEFLGDVAEILKPGVLFESIFRAGLEAGHFSYGDDVTDIEVAVATRMAEHRSPSQEWELLQNTGRWLRIAERRTDDGGTIVLQTDITEFKKRDAELQRSVSQLEAISANSPGVLYQQMLDAHNNYSFAYVSSDVVDLFGLDAEDFKSRGNVFGYLVDSRDRDAYFEALEQSARDLSELDLEFRVNTFNRKHRWVHTKATPRREEGGVTVWDGYVWDTTESQAALAELEENRKTLEEKTSLLETTIGTMSDGIAVYGPNYHLMAWNQRYIDIFEFPDGLVSEETTLDDLLRFSVDRGDFGDKSYEEIAAVQSALGGRNEAQKYERPGPVNSVIEVRIQPMPTGGMVSIFSDITDRKRAEHAMQAEQEKLANLITYMPAGVIMLDSDYRFLAVSDRWLDNFKVYGGTRETIIGRTYFEVYPAAPETYRQMFDKVLTGKIQSNDRQEIYWPDGSKHWVRWEARPWIASDNAIGGITLFGEVITDQVEAEERILFHASYDELTKLPNRRLFNDRLEETLAQAKRSGNPIALLLIDLDGFKSVNDTHGHGAGDELLKEVARRLKACTRAGDTVARLGGDEFTAILTTLSHEEDAGRVGNKILAAINEPIMAEGNEVRVGGSIGVAVFPDDGEDAEGLLRNADTAMYRAKNGGKNMVVFFQSDFDEKSAKRLTIESELRHAIDENQLMLHYQPRILTHDRSCVGVEALVRWQHPERGLVPPGAFIPVAEESGLIVRLGEWVMKEACRAAKRWEDAGFGDLRVAVNVSSMQFRRGNLMDLVNDSLSESGLSADRLEVEITEGTLMEEPEAAAELLNSIRGLGTHVAVDDFGIGYSCLSYLKKLPLDILKIDASFVREVTTDADDAAIVTTIIELADNLRLGVIAEGVETEDHARFLSEKGCKEAQGFLYSRPLPEADLIKFLTESDTADGD